MATFRELLGDVCGEWVTLSEAELTVLESYYNMLIRWNQKMNLTSVSEPRDVVRKHFGESLFLGTILNQGGSLVDVGSGAGLPGIPIAVLHPEMSVLLVESDRRKAIFLREASSGLSNVSIFADRAEKLNGSFDWVVSRAVKAEDVIEVAKRIGRRVALVVGEAAAVGGGIEWSQSLKFPWPRSGRVILGDVPRETIAAP